MVGSTAGTWLNYATTIIFQILFAKSFGTGADASAFFIAFVSVASIANVLNGTVHVIALPRLVGDDGQLHVGPLKLMAAAAVAAVAGGAILIVFADAVAEMAGTVSNGGGDLIRATAAYLVFRVFATLLGTLGLARGHRFLPVAAPALPTIAAAIYLLAPQPAPDVTGTMAVLTIGSILQCVVLLPLLVRRSGLASGGLGKVRTLTVATAAQLALLVALPPLQRIMSSVDSASGAATAHYGLQGLQVAQQLLIGGLAVAAFADWSRLHDRTALGAALARTTALATLLLAVAAMVGAVAAPTLVRVLFQRGDFTASDTAAVVSVVRLGVAGFFAEGVALVAVQVLVATRRNWIAIRIGVFKFAVIASLTVAGGILAGANGVAIAYSIGSVVTLIVALPICFRLVTLPDDARRVLERTAIGVTGIGLFALLVTVVASSLPDVVQATAILVASAMVVLVLRLPIRSWHEVTHTASPAFRDQT